MQEPRAARAVAEKPEAFAASSFDAIIITADVVPAPPARFDSLRAPGARDFVKPLPPCKLTRTLIGRLGFNAHRQRRQKIDWIRWASAACDGGLCGLAQPGDVFP